MKKRRILLALLGILVGWGGASMATANPQTVTFQATDTPGNWFDCTGSTYGCVSYGGVKGVGGEKSLAIIHPGDSVSFSTTAGKVNTLHTAVTLMVPHGVTPWDIGDPLLPNGSNSPSVPLTLTVPGLYVFYCDIHPYMFAAVIVDNPDTTVHHPTGGGTGTGDQAAFDLGDSVDLPKLTPGGINQNPLALGASNIQITADVVLRLVHTFFIISDNDNWLHFPAHGSQDWKPAYPGVAVLAGSSVVPNLDVFLRGYFHEGGPGTSAPANCLTTEQLSDGTCPRKSLAAPLHPTHPGVGQVWVDTQFETVAGKNKPGTATAVDATSWKVERKVGLPHHNMNNPHNMWTDRDQTVIYQTEWFDHYLTVFDRKTGAFVNRIEAGEAPAHVMTRTTNDQVHVSQNAGNNVRELDSWAGTSPLPANTNKFIRDIPMSDAKGASVHPHAHWMSADGSLMVTPNEDEVTSTLYSFTYGHQKDPQGVLWPGSIVKTSMTGHSPIATGMMPDSSKYYVANFLDSTISVIAITGLPSVPTATWMKDINLWGNYDPVSGQCITKSGELPCTPANGQFIGALPIQTPVSPDGRFMVTANTLTGTITIVDTHSDTVVAMLPCDPGCHGVQFGAKQGGGYYAYVSSKLSNRMLVVDPNPNGQPRPYNGKDATIVGSVLLTSDDAPSDGSVIGNKGMGGQGILPIPLVYNGWVQHLPEEWREKLTWQQRHPLGY